MAQGSLSNHLVLCLLGIRVSESPEVYNFNGSFWVAIHPTKEIPTKSRHASTPKVLMEFCLVWLIGC